MLPLILALAVAGPDPRPAVVDMMMLEGSWRSEAKVELAIRGGTINVDAGDGFNGFSGRLLVQPRSGRFAIAADGNFTEARYELSGDVLILTTGGVKVEYRRRGVGR
jgi:hypothetical protein